MRTAAARIGDRHISSLPAGELWVCQLGLVPYAQATEMQARIHRLRLEGELPDTLLLLEHPAVFTRGRRASDAELPYPQEFYRSHGIQVLSSDRGGRVTYHGPGQLVGYPVMRVADVHGHLRSMEAAIVAALAQEGLTARARAAEGPDYTGVWVQTRKIASIGVHVSRGVATHGFAVNVENDLEPFSWVVACGLPDVQMTSIARERVRTAAPEASCAPTLGCFRRRLAHSFCEVHGLRQRLVSPSRLGIEATCAPARRLEAIAA